MPKNTARRFRKSSCSPPNAPCRRTAIKWTGPCTTSRLGTFPKTDIDALREEAKKQAADKRRWKKTREGAWVSGGKARRCRQDRPRPRTARIPGAGLLCGPRLTASSSRHNVHVDEMVVDNTVNLFQIADVNRLLVIANAPEDQLPVLEALHEGQRRWTVQTVGADPSAGLPGTIDEIGYLIDPNQHTAVIKGYVDNPGQRLRAGQYVTATVPIPPPAGVVEIPIDAMVDDGQQSLVFVQTDAAKSLYTMRRVQVTNRFDQKVFVRSRRSPRTRAIDRPRGRRRLAAERDPSAGRTPPAVGDGELKAALLNLESQPEGAPAASNR